MFVSFCEQRRIPGFLLAQLDATGEKQMTVHFENYCSTDSTKERLEQTTATDVSLPVGTTEPIESLDDGTLLEGRSTSWGAPIAGAILVLSPLLLVILVSSSSTTATVTSSDSTFEASTTTPDRAAFSQSKSLATRDVQAGTDERTGADGMTVRNFARAIAGRSWDASEFYARYGKPVRIFKPYQTFVYLSFRCRDGIAEVECEATGFEMYSVIDHISVRRK